MTHTNGTGASISDILENNQDYQQEQKDDNALSDASHLLNEHADGNGREPQEILPAKYKWIREDSHIYKTLEAAAQKRVKGTYLTDIHADFDKEIVYNLIKAGTPYKNRHITPALDRLRKGKIWIEFSDGYRLVFVDNVKEFTDGPAPEVIPKNDPVPSQAIEKSPPQEDTSIICPTSSIQKRVFVAALQAIKDAHAEIQVKIEDYNKTIDWVIASFENVLTAEEVESLKEKIIG